MISLSAPTYDPNGHLRLPCRGSNPYQGQRRGSVTATLDGGVSVYDTGYSIADQTLTATMTAPTKAQLVSLQYLVAYYGEIVLCCETGAYRALLSFAVSKNTLSISLRLLSRLDA
jgi:hypothetical protein